MKVGVLDEGYKHKDTPQSFWDRMADIHGPEVVPHEFRHCDYGWVRGERVKILGVKSDSFRGLGWRNGTICVEYPDGEVGAVMPEDISFKEDGS